MPRYNFGPRTVRIEAPTKIGLAIIAVAIVANAAVALGFFTSSIAYNMAAIIISRH